jgi:hypothetical protein
VNEAPQPAADALAEANAEFARAALLAAIARLREEYERAVQPFVARLCRLEAGKR